MNQLPPPSEQVEELSKRLLGAVASYAFSYQGEDLLSAVALWGELRPHIVKLSQGYHFRLIFEKPVTLGTRASQVRRLAREVQFFDTDEVLVRVGRFRHNVVTVIEGTVMRPEQLTSLQRVFSQELHALSWLPIAGSRIPTSLTAELDRFVRVLEWTCDFEAAFAILHEVPRGGFDAARALMFLLGTKYQPTLPSYSGWKTYPVVRESETILESHRRSFEQSVFGGLDDRRVASIGHRDVEAPLRRFQVAKDALVFEGGTVLTPRGLVDFDECQRSTYDFVAGRWNHVVGSSATLNVAGVRVPTDTAEHVDQAILLSGRADMNWYHWMIEHLPRLIQLEDVVDPAVPVLVSDRLSVNGIAALRSCTEREIIVTPAEHVTTVNELFLPGNCVFHIDTLELPWEAGTSLDFDAIDIVRHRILGATPDLIDPASPKRVFWYRESTHRNLTNQDDIVAVAKNWGFTVIHPEKCSFHEQVRLFHNAEVVISAMGAVTPNFLFTRPGTTIISMTSEASADYIFPAVIAEHVGSKSISLVGSFAQAGNERQKLDYFHQPFTVDPELLANELNRQLGPA